MQNLENSKTQIFLDSGNPGDTVAALEVLGFLDGQTTNPSLMAKALKDSGALSEQEVLDGYKAIVQKIREQLQNEESISIEVNANAGSTAEDLFAQAKEMNTWITGAHIKFPITEAGMMAAEMCLKAGIKVNMTLCFSLEQALAVHEMAVSVEAEPGDVFVSPFMGRLDEIGEDGVGVTEEIQASYNALMSPVMVLAASVRTVEHLDEVIAAGIDQVTVPMNVLLEWAGEEEAESEVANATESESWKDYDLSHELTTKGLNTFAEDWSALITK